MGNTQISSVGTWEGLTLPIVLSKKIIERNDLLFSQGKIKYACRAHSLIMFLDPGAGGIFYTANMKSAVNWGFQFKF